MSMYYKVPERRGNRAYKFKSRYALTNGDNDYMLECMAEEAAEDFHDDRDGWEGSWPITITLHTQPDSEAVAKFSIDREFVPSFTVTKE